MVKHLMIVLMCAILTSLTSANVVSFKIEQGIDSSYFDNYEHMVLSLKNWEDGNSLFLDSLMDGAIAYYQKMVKNNDWEERSIIWLRSSIEPGALNGGILMVRQ